MVFCFENMDIDTINLEYGGHMSTNDIVVLSKSVCGTINLPDEVKGKTNFVKGLAMFSRQKEVILLVAMNAQIGSKVFDSVMVIDKGKILGVSDCIVPQKGDIYEKGSSQRGYATSMGRVSLFVGKDIMYAELWQFALGSRYIISICDSAYDSLQIAYARALAGYLGKYVLVLFADSVISISPYGGIDSIKQGRMTAFYLPMSLAKGKRIGRKIKYIQEES